MVLLVTGRVTLGNEPLGDHDAPSVVAPPVTTVPDPQPDRVNWPTLIRQELRFLLVEHAFRWATEPGTRRGGTGLGPGYWNSLASLHGWADGDPFYVNYLGHPIQGSVAGFIFQQNDGSYRAARFGRNPAYWKAKLRATAFAWAQSEQFEIGPFSEASIGHIQSQFPQQGFVDHAITPVMGLVWQLAEDSVDEYVIGWIESHTARPWVRNLARTGLNPTRSFAKLIALRAPWNRDDRPRAARGPTEPVIRLPRSTTSFELSVASRFETYLGPRGGTCVGADVSGAWRIAPEWMLVAQVGGCNVMGNQTGVSGDSLNYLLGPRWTPAPAKRWSPWIQFLMGGSKISREQTMPDRKKPLASHDEYTTSDDSNALTVHFGAGVDLNMGSAFAVRLANLELSRSSFPVSHAQNYNTSVQFTTGFVLRIGTW